MRMKNKPQNRNNTHPPEMERTGKSQTVEPLNHGISFSSLDHSWNFPERFSSVSNFQRMCVVPVLCLLEMSSVVWKEQGVRLLVTFFL